MNTDNCVIACRENPDRYASALTPIPRRCFVPIWANAAYLGEMEVSCDSVRVE
jgi:hypothetical protein